MISSSSMTRMEAVVLMPSSRESGRTDFDKGSRSMNRVPWPTLLSTCIVPSCSRTMPYAIDSPRPVPCPMDLVVKNGS